jgi:hypothetical protein
VWLISPDEMFDGIYNGQLVPGDLFKFILKELNSDIVFHDNAHVSFIGVLGHDG